MNKKAVLNLKDIPTPERPKVELLSGRSVSVAPLDGEVAALYREYAASGNGLLLWDIVALLLPDATKDEVRALTIDQCGAVVKLSAETSSFAGPQPVQISAEPEVRSRSRMPLFAPPRQRG